jgi:hypothetical protein
MLYIILTLSKVLKENVDFKVQLDRKVKRGQKDRLVLKVLKEIVENQLKEIRVIKEKMVKMV